MKLVILLSLASAAMAQTGSGGGSSGAVSNSNWFVSSNGSGMAGAVTGAPYSAEQITETVQTLADGTHITGPVQKTKFYRDSQGRTRNELTIPMPAGMPERGV